MFSQFRQTVESLASVPPRRSSDISPASDNDNSYRSKSPDYGTKPATSLSSSQPKLTNIRRPISSQRTHSANFVPRVPATGKKLSLEDRLRASLTVGDMTREEPVPQSQMVPSSAPPLSDLAREASPSLHSERPVSPTLIPLPDSPVLSPVLAKPLIDNPTGFNVSVQDEVHAIHEQPLNESMTDDCTKVEELLVTIDSSTTLAVKGDMGAAPTVDQNGQKQADVDSLQERLKQVEQRFLDVSRSFKKLQADKAAADAVLQELTPLSTIQDAAALQDYLQTIISKTSMYQDGISELGAKLQRQEKRINELRETHQLESRSQLELIEQLRSHANEVEALFKASQDASSQVQGNLDKQSLEVDKLRTELERSRNVSKEEEEKRVKAISLLKTVRQKLVKTEKERDDAIKEVSSLKQKEQGDKDKGQTERLHLQEELSVVRAEKERALAKLKAQFDKEHANTKERYEKELSALKGQFELESVTFKATHVKELSLKVSQVATLENSLNNVTREKNEIFDQLQMRQAEVESAHSHIESLQNQNSELQYQLRETQDRIGLLTYDLQEARREQDNRSNQPSPSAEEVARLLSSTENKYESKVAEMRNQIRRLEKERNEGEAEWSHKLRDRIKEVDDLKKLLEVSVKSQEQAEELVKSLNAEKAELQDQNRLTQQKLLELSATGDRLDNIEKSHKEQETELTIKIRSLEQQLQEANSREAQLRQNNKTLREELRKVQSSVAVLERQRSPGIGYWSSRGGDNGPAEPRTSISSTQSNVASRTASPTLTSVTVSTQNEEDVNLEYLRNIILQFLEHKEMRPNLVRVISTILRFTPQETRRLIAKSGISASKWLSLCKLFISKESSIQSSEEIEHNLSSGSLVSTPLTILTSRTDSVLVLYRSYPGDADLQRYLHHAVDSGMISVSVFTATFLQAARSTEFHTATTLHSLCRTAIDTHYASGSPSIISLIELPSKSMNVIQDAMALLRTAQSLPMSHYHQLTSSASELLILLLSCITDMSQIPTRQAVVFLSDANQLLQSFRLLPDVRHVLETFALSLSLLIGDDAKAATEAQLMHTLHYSSGEGDGMAASADADIITFSLVLNHVVTYRAHCFGSGSGNDPVALLVGLHRWTSWTPTTFYTQLFTAALTCLSQSSVDAPIWKAFIVGRLPQLLSVFQDVVATENSRADWRSAMQAALSAVFLRPDLIVASDLALSRPVGGNDGREEMRQSFTRGLLLQLIASGLLDLAFALEKDPGISNDTVHRLHAEAQDINLDIETLIESKLMPDVNDMEFRVWMDRVWKDVMSHAIFAQVVFKRYVSLARVLDIEALSHLCKILYTYEFVLDILALQVRISDLLFHALLLLEEYDCETIGDPQTAVSHLGDIVLFAQYMISRFHLNNEEFMKDQRTVSAGYLKRTDFVFSINEFSADELAAYSAWHKALFDSSSEGIEDTILRITKPKTLLRISATLFLEAVRASTLQKIDHEVLSNGVSYFTGPILNWTLLGVVKALLKEIRQKGFTATTHLEMLQNLLLSSTCPQPVLCMCGPDILNLIIDRKRLFSDANTFNADSIQRVIADAMGQTDHETTLARSNPLGLHTSFEGQPKSVIRYALAMARTGKGPAIDVERCLGIMPPSKFLDVLWSELIESTSVGENESCRRIATFILTMPRCTATPPLLPIFIHLMVPTLIARIEQQPASEQAMTTELLVTLISSALTAALHIEWAVQKVTSEHRSFLGQTSAAMARRLAADLRARELNNVSSMILQRLAASQTFVANFPVFMTT
ncbi:hypothetical protein AX17_000236 [Amanita inopinata Kibby_2008]|nr:hypothetical protein AX17_000236 [Amanita inopinata Kibby_2008]